MAASNASASASGSPPRKTSPPNANAATRDPSPASKSERKASVPTEDARPTSSRSAGAGPPGITVAPSTTTPATKPPLPAVLHRPPIRPSIPAASKSKFELEPNPFEQSFSRSSNSIRTGAQSSSSSEDVHATAREREKSHAGAAGKSEDGAKPEPASPSAETPALPPLSALTSPAPDPANHFSWSGLSSSLRAGPLSPAMLTGPAATAGHLPHGASALSHGTGLTPQLGAGATGVYDPAAFRTGFTPGSGFTPSFGGAYGGPSSFPMPSPNTAAFLSMVTNSTPNGPNEAAAAAAAAAGGGQSQNGQQAGVAASQAQGAPGAQVNGQQANGAAGVPPPAVNQLDSTITPNTLNALTGVINSMNNIPQGYPEPPQEPQGYPGHPQRHPQGPPHMQHPDSYFHPGQHHPGMQIHRQGSPSNHPPHMQQQQHLPPHMLQQMGPQGNQAMPPQMGMPPSHLHDQGGYPPRNAGAGGAPNQAANGLFLLSQAHQELSKREEESKGDNVVPPAKGGAKGKRKSEEGTRAAANKPPAKKAKKGAAAAAAEVSVRDHRTSLSSGASPEYDDDDNDPDSSLLEMAGYEQSQRAGSQAPSKNGSNSKPETEEEKRKNFLERNRQGEGRATEGRPAGKLLTLPPFVAALKCRQRKKAWLGQLQTKVDGLTADNDRLKNVIQNMTDEMARISAVLNSHRDCPGMGTSLAQVGLSVLPGPPPHGGPYHHGPPPGMMPQQMAPNGAPMLQTGFRQASQPLQAPNGRPYAQQETTA